ncbi:MAG: putative metal-binding motif-containing protein, partial [Chitinophagaceae bacterium]|nr:putative metal-binding motif-containing protein [Chitinophagaceae bacterium]
SILACAAPQGYVSNSTDCDDSKANVHPGATEICDGLDNDCDGDIDEGVKLTFYRDSDGDGYGNLAITTLACTVPAGYVSNSTDCNDQVASIYPGATEIMCNGIDDDCDGLVDEDIVQTTTSVIIAQSSTQYSDQVSLTAELTPAVANGGCQAATHVTFRIGTKLIGTFPLQLSGNKLSATTNVTLYEALGSSDYSPGNKTVTATFSGVNAAFNVNTATGTLTITREDARVNYTGAPFASTSCQTCSNATVTLSATVQDISATNDAAGDNLSGDIRLARVRFVNRDNGAAISGWLTPGLVNSADLRTGTVTFNWTVNIGSADAEQYTVGIEVDGYYTRNQGSDNAVINVAKPLNDFVTGGGFIVASNSAGRYASDPGTKNNFGFNVKYNKSGKNLQGKLNFIVRRTESGVLL